jgi:hypothetical protein
VTDVKRFRKPEDAQRYVAGSVAALLQNEFDNGSGWLSLNEDEEDVGNLADLKTEKLVHEATRQLIRQLQAHSEGKTSGNPPSQTEWAEAAWKLYSCIHSRGERTSFELFMVTLMPLIQRSGVKEPTK